MESSLKPVLYYTNQLPHYFGQEPVMDFFFLNLHILYFLAFKTAIRSRGKHMECEMWSETSLKVQKRPSTKLMIPSYVIHNSSLFSVKKVFVGLGNPRKEIMYLWLNNSVQQKPCNLKSDTSNFPSNKSYFLRIWSYFKEINLSYRGTKKHHTVTNFVCLQSKPISPSYWGSNAPCKLENKHTLQNKLCQVKFFWSG